jgi:hydroxymethylbilane synthase
MNTHTKIRIGTRQSPLALAQTDLIINQMELSESEYCIVPIISTGDKTEGLLRNQGGKALFAKELHQQLLDNNIDIAVHSMKDLETPLPTGLSIGATSKREDPRDMIILRPGLDWNNLEKTAITVGTASLRREQFLKFYLNKNCKVAPCRGNIQTRINKLKDGEFDAITLAIAGLKRAKIFHNGKLNDLENFSYHVFDTETLVPASGQGTLAVVKRTDDKRFDYLLQKINHQESAEETSIERYFLENIHATCHDAIGAFAQVNNQEFTLSIMFFDHLKSPLHLSSGSKVAEKYELLDSLLNTFKKACEFRKNS